jgi:hypothetical protein
LIHLGHQALLLFPPPPLFFFPLLSKAFGLPSGILSAGVEGVILIITEVLV